MSGRVSIKRAAVFAAAGAAALAALCAGVSLGSAAVRPLDTLRALFGAGGVDPKTAAIVRQLRAPRALLAFLAGGSFALAGAVFQSLLKNTLASPHILGVSAGASLGAGLVLLSGASLPFAAGWTLPLAGLAGALLSTCIVIGLAAALDRRFSNNTVVLLGMVFSLFVNAILTTLAACYREEMKNLLYWQLGSFSLKGWPQALSLLPAAAAAFVLFMLCGKQMDILSFGEEDALSLGVNAKRARLLLLAAGAALTGSAAALCGAIGFVDLIAPCVARALVGASQRRVLPLSFLLGGALLTIADLAARTVVSPSELPVGAVTALIGAPFFAWVYFRGGGRYG